MTTFVEDKTVEARRLRWLLDTQPSCLMRVASTGEILAANDAAIELLGAGERKLALGASLTNWIVPDQIGSWHDFVERVVAGGRTSLETNLITGDLRRRALFHGAPLLDHPDGVSSLLVAAHDISERMVLETAIEHLRQSAQDAGASADDMDGETIVPLDEPLVDEESLQERFVRLATDHESAMAAATASAEEQQRLQRQLEQQIEQLTAAHQSAQAALAEAIEAREWIQRDFEERLAAAQQPKQAPSEPVGSVHRLQRQLEEQQAQLEALDAERVATVKQLVGAMAGRFQAEVRLQEFLREHEAQLKAQTDCDLRTGSSRIASNSGPASSKESVE